MISNIKITQKTSHKQPLGQFWRGDMKMLDTFSLEKFMWIQDQEGEHPNCNKQPILMITSNLITFGKGYGKYMTAAKTMGSAGFTRNPEDKGWAEQQTKYVQELAAAVLTSERCP
jgi:hypothetical protein